MADEQPGGAGFEGGVLVVRPGGGANCSSVGSVVDMLFVAGALGGALLVAVTAALDEAPEAGAPEAPADEDPAPGEAGG